MPDGTKWSTVTSGGLYPNGRYHDVWGTSATNAYAVGNYIAHHDGTSWSTQSSQMSTLVHGIWGASSTQVCIMAGNVLRYFDGSSWKPMGTWPSHSFTGAWAVSGATHCLVGNKGEILTNGKGPWQDVTSGTRDNLRGVWGTSRTDLYATGANGLVLHHGVGLVLVSTDAAASPSAGGSAHPALPKSMNRQRRGCALRR